MKRVLKKTIAAALTAAMVLSLAPANGAEAAKKPKLSKKKATLVKGKTLKLKVKNGNKKAKVTWKTNKKKIVKITKKSSKGNKATATVKALKKGKANITASYKLGKKTTKLVCKITVKEKGSSQQGGAGGTSSAPSATTVATGTPAPGGDTQVSAPPTVTDDGQQSTPPDETTEPSKTPKPPKTPTPLPKNSSVQAHKIGRAEEVKVNGRVDKLANGTEWENTTDAEIDLLASKEASVRGTSTITAAKAVLMWDTVEKIGENAQGDVTTGENALYAKVEVKKPGTPSGSDKVTLLVSEDGETVNKVEAVVGSTSDEGAAAVSDGGYIAELKIPLSGAHAVSTEEAPQKLKIDIMITEGDATINYFDTMTELEWQKEADGSYKVDDNNRIIAVPSGPAVTVTTNAKVMGDMELIDSMAAAAQAYYTASGAAIREIADLENGKWDWQITAEPAEGEEAEEPTDNGVKSKVMKFVPTDFWTSVYKANESESIAFPNVNADGWEMDGEISLADKVTDDEGNATGWEASRDKVQSYVLWDDGYMYVLFDVNDDDITAPDGDPYLRDSVEFFLDQDYSAPGTYDEGNGDEVQLRVLAANNTFSSNDTGTNAYELVAHAVAYKKADGTYAEAYNSEGVTGYQVEMIIQFQKDDAHKTPANGDIMGMELQVNDCHTTYQQKEVDDGLGGTIMVDDPETAVGKRAGTITAFDRTNNCYQYPNCFGRVKLFGGGEGENPGPGDDDNVADVEATFTDTAITIDGAIDAAWADAPLQPVANVIPASDKEPGTTTANAKLMWDAENLYVLVLVSDPDIDTCATDYKSDGGEIFLDEDNSKEDTYAANTDAFQYRFTGLSEDGAAPITSDFTGNVSAAAKEAYAIESAYQVVRNSDNAVIGYRMEHKIPWKNAAVANQVVGFELNVFDCSNGDRNNELYLIGTKDTENIGDLWQNPSPMGTLLLAPAKESLTLTADYVAGMGAVGTPTYDKNGVTNEFQIGSGGGGMCFWLNKEKTAVDLSQYSKVRIKISSDTADSKMALKFITVGDGSYWHYEGDEVLHFDDDALAFTLDEADKLKTVDVDLSKMSSDNADTKAFTVGVQYLGEWANTAEKVNITIKSIELIK